MLQSQAPRAKPFLSPPPCGSTVYFCPLMASMRGTVHTVLTAMHTHARTRGGGARQDQENGGVDGQEVDAGGRWRHKHKRDDVKHAGLVQVFTGMAVWCVFAGPSLSGSVVLSSRAGSSPTHRGPSHPRLRPAGPPGYTCYRLYSLSVALCTLSCTVELQEAYQYVLSGN